MQTLVRAGKQLWKWRLLRNVHLDSDNLGAAGYARIRAEKSITYVCKLHLFPRSFQLHSMCACQMKNSSTR
jgi:hypothetical protein